MSVWNSIVGQAQVVEQLKAIASGDPKAIAQSWLICGPPGSGRSNVARAFAAALESPDHGLNDEPTKTTEQVLAGTHPDVSVLATNKVTIGIDEVRDIITTSEQMPGTAPWRIIIIEDVDRMMERTTNVLLKEIEEPSPHAIWLLCAPSAQDVLPTIRSRTRIVNLAVPSNQAVAKFLESQGFEPNIAARAARLSEGHIGIASLYAKDERVMTDRDELIVGVLGLHRASDAVLLAGNLIDNAKAQAEAEVNVKASEAEADFRRINGLGPKDRIPPKLRGAYNAIAKKDELKRRATRLTRDVLDRALNSVASIYRDVAVLQNNAEDAVGLINLENRSAITELSVRLDRTGAVRRLSEYEVLTTLPMHRTIAWDESDEVSLLVPGCSMTYSWRVSGEAEYVYESPEYIASRGIVTLVVGMPSVRTTLAAVGVQTDGVAALRVTVRVAGESVAEVHYRIEPREPGSVRLCWFNRMGGLDYHTFGRPDTGYLEASREAFLNHAGYAAASVRLADRTELSSGYLPRLWMEGLALIPASPRVWRVEEEGFVPTDVFPLSHAFRNGVPGTITLTVRDRTPRLSQNF
mgnify:CR=1 FL=1